MSNMYPRNVPELIYIYIPFCLLLSIIECIYIICGQLSVNCETKLSFIQFLKIFSIQFDIDIRININQYKSIKMINISFLF